MIKIIKHGEFEAHKMTCGECGCVFTYDKRDVLHNAGPYGEAKRVKCPDCETPCLVSSRIWGLDEEIVGIE